MAQNFDDTAFPDWFRGLPSVLAVDYRKNQPKSKKKNTETVNEYSDNMPFLTFDPKQNTFSFFLTINIAFKQVSFESIKDR